MLLPMLCGECMAWNSYCWKYAALESIPIKVFPSVEATSGEPKNWLMFPLEIIRNIMSLMAIEIYWFLDYYRVLAL